MNARRPPWMLLAWPAVLLALLLAGWTIGYVYWQIQISRAIAELRKGPKKYLESPRYVDPELFRIGSRGIPRLIRELDDALARSDEEQAIAFYCGAGDVLNAAAHPSAEAAIERGAYHELRHRPSMAEMRKECTEFQKDWPEHRKKYAPWWKWWRGHHVPNF